MQTKQTFKKIVGGGMAAATLAGVGVAATAPAANASVWDQLAQCESGGDWSINTGNGFYGGLQFSQSSWAAMGGSGLPSEASKAEQIQRAEQLQSVQGWGAWPSCSAQLGLSGDPAPQPEPEPEPADQGPTEAELEAQRQAEQEAEAQAEAEQQAQAEAEAQRQAEQQAQAEAQAQQQAEQQSAAQPAEVEASGETHQVEAGETLAKIAADHGIENWRDLWAANSDQIEDPNLIYVGDELKLPVA
ncbi:resuscitation-promoting factor Rpf [Nesterenkonia sp. F]|uniref:resuscitation-promoting factor Rpf n=1 Tax=Nesterenkonia sp. F TaxID=795955 RepID=UPI000255C8FB|nr:transglycosylase family protein [Nesterenkonia sp. F]